MEIEFDAGYAHLTFCNNRYSIQKLNPFCFCLETEKDLSRSLSKKCDLVEVSIDFHLLENNLGHISLLKIFITK